MAVNPWANPWGAWQPQVTPVEKQPIWRSPQAQGQGFYNWAYDPNMKRLISPGGTPSGPQAVNWYDMPQQTRQSIMNAPWWTSLQQVMQPGLQNQAGSYISRQMPQQQANPWASWGQQFRQAQPYNPYQQQGFGGYGGGGYGYQAQPYQRPQNPWSNWGRQQGYGNQGYGNQGFGFNQNYGGW